MYAGYVIGVGKMAHKWEKEEPQDFKPCEPYGSHLSVTNCDISTLTFCSRHFVSQCQVNGRE